MRPEVWAPYLAAVAAVIAAVLTAVNLWLTGRREQRSWARSALQGAFVDFLTASYHHRDACRLIVESHLQGTSTEATDDRWLAETEEARRVMLDCISKLRVLASGETADLAQRVIKHNERDIEYITGARFDNFEATRPDRKIEFNRDRDNFTKKAVKLLGIPYRDSRPRR